MHTHIANIAQLFTRLFALLVNSVNMNVTMNNQRGIILSSICRTFQDTRVALLLRTNISAVNFVPRLDVNINTVTGKLFGTWRARNPYKGERQFIDIIHPSCWTCERNKSPANAKRV